MIHKPPKLEQVTVKGEIVEVWHPENNSPGFCISMTSGGWLLGTYDSKSSACLGAECCFIDEQAFVTELQQKVNHFDKGDRLLTIQDLNKWISSRKQDK